MRELERFLLQELIALRVPRASPINKVEITSQQRKFTVVSHFKEFAAGYGPNVERALSAHSHGTYASDSMPETFYTIGIAHKKCMTLQILRNNLRCVRE